MSNSKRNASLREKNALFREKLAERNPFFREKRAKTRKASRETYGDSPEDAYAKGFGQAKAVGPGEGDAPLARKRTKGLKADVLRAQHNFLRARQQYEKLAVAEEKKDIKALMRDISKLKATEKLSDEEIQKLYDIVLSNYIEAEAHSKLVPQLEKLERILMRSLSRSLRVFG